MTPGLADYSNRLRALPGTVNPGMAISWQWPADAACMPICRRCPHYMQVITIIN